MASSGVLSELLPSCSLEGAWCSPGLGFAMFLVETWPWMLALEWLVHMIVSCSLSLIHSVLCGFPRPLPSVLPGKLTSLVPGLLLPYLSHVSFRLPLCILQMAVHFLTHLFLPHSDNYAPFLDTFEYLTISQLTRQVSFSH